MDMNLSVAYMDFSLIGNFNDSNFNFLPNPVLLNARYPIFTKSLFLDFFEI